MSNQWRCTRKRSHGPCNALNGTEETNCGACGEDRADALDECECEDDCQRCSGEFCNQHGNDPCDCDVLDRHAPRADATAGKASPQPLAAGLRECLENAWAASWSQSPWHKSPHDHFQNVLAAADAFATAPSAPTVCAECARLREAATALYKAGFWEMDYDAMGISEQAKLWETLREALGDPGAASQEGRHE